LIAMRTTEQNRLGSAPRLLQADSPAPIAGLHARRAAFDDDLDTTLRASAVWRARGVATDGPRHGPGLGPPPRARPPGVRPAEPPAAGDPGGGGALEWR